MHIVIEAHELPGVRFVSDGHLLTNIHVGLQVRREPAQLVRADAARATWELDVQVVDGGIDFRGPAVQGKKGERFIYLTWGEVDPDGAFAMFRRAKLMFADIDPTMVAAAATGAGDLVASLGLTDEHGCPRCARVRPPTITWRLG